MTTNANKSTTTLPVPYYRLESPNSGVALAGGAPGIDDGALHLVFVEDPCEAVWHPDWKPLTLSTAGELVDWLPSYLAVSLCSQHMRSIIDENKGPHDVIEWLPVSVNGRPYWVPNLPERPRVLDDAGTLAFNGSVIKPVLVRRELADRHFFGVPGGGKGLIVVSKRMKALLEKNCTNVEFSKVEVV